MTIDKGFGSDAMSVAVRHPWIESGRERTTLTVQKWDDDQTEWAIGKLGFRGVIPEITPDMFAMVGVKPYDTYVYEGNLITLAGWNQFFLGGIIGTTGTKFSATVGRIGVGTSVSAATSADTALGSIASMTGNNWILCGANPTVQTAASPATAIFTATFGATAAVGAWNEFAIDQGTASAGPTVTATAPMMNHSANIGAGTKAGGTWTATATLSFT